MSQVYARISTHQKHGRSPGVPHVRLHVQKIVAAQVHVTRYYTTDPQAKVHNKVAAEKDHDAGDSHEAY